MRGDNLIQGMKQVSNSLEKLNSDADDQTELYLRFDAHLQNATSMILEQD